MANFDYAAYLQSEKWQEKRRKIFKRDRYRCCICGAAKNLRCHHITYENIGHEKDSDLATLCDTCHENLHQGNDYYDHLCIAWDRLHDALEIAKTDEGKELIQKQLDILDEVSTQIVKLRIKVAEIEAKNATSL